MTTFIEQHLLVQKKLKAKTILVREGEVANELYFISKGSIRAWFDQEGKDISLQFFFENDSVTSLESFLENKPSKFNIETMEACTVSILQKDDFLHLMQSSKEMKDWFFETAVKKLISHSNRLLFLLKNKPYQRYQQLMTDNPELIQKVSQRYIASYLGITPVSLSRIRSRVV